MTRKKVDLTGQRFGKLAVLSEVPERDRNKKVLWNCLCDCGKQIQVVGGALKSGSTKSCGCITTAIDLTGQRFGNLVAIKDVGRKNSVVLWECLCDCGKHTNVVSSCLKRGDTKSCGCMPTKVDLTGQRFGKWTVLGDSGKRSGGSVMWNCVCDCGESRKVSGCSLKRGRSSSCGCMKVKDLIGKRFGSVTVKRAVGRKNRNVLWECLCDCGGVMYVQTNNLTSGNTKSCGCSKLKDLVGQRFGMLVVIKDVGRENGKVVWECLCDCGNYKNVITGKLLSGNTKSCGCLQHPSGIDHPNYNPNLTEEDRLRRHYYMGGGNQGSWSKQVMERDAYTCQICNQYGVNINAHHINAWNAFPEQRFDLDNGVTLCTDCHKDFHSQYGYGDNTREQFDEYAASKTLVLN